LPTKKLKAVHGDIRITAKKDCQPAVAFLNK
jgi:hypothetical protein